MDVHSVAPRITAGRRTIEAGSVTTRRRPVARATGRAAGVDRGAVADHGAATAELAVVLPAVVLLAGLAVWAVMVVAAHLRCVDAAGVGARALARGESRGQVEAVVGQVAPPGARVRLSRDGDLVVVEVRARVRLPGPWALSGPGVEVGDEAVAVAEDADDVSASGDPGPGDPVPGDPGTAGGGTERSVP